MKIEFLMHEDDGMMVADLSIQWSLAAPLHFHDPEGKNPRAFGLPHPRTAPFCQGDFVASVAKGGPVNCFDVHFWPHGNGTHTETMGHITQGLVPVGTQPVPTLMLATFLDATATPVSQSSEHPGQLAKSEDMVITATALQDASKTHAPSLSKSKALILRTRLDECARDESGQNPPYFTYEAMRWVVAQGIDHLIVDLPSVDREEDGGELGAHRIFWGFAPGQVTPPAGARFDRTITEFACIPKSLPPGFYLLNLQLPAFMLDAAPSRPILHPLAFAPKEPNAP